MTRTNEKIYPSSKRSRIDWCCNSSVSQADAAWTEITTPPIGFQSEGSFAKEPELDRPARNRLASATLGKMSQ